MRQEWKNKEFQVIPGPVPPCDRHGPCAEGRAEVEDRRLQMEGRRPGVRRCLGVRWNPGPIQQPCLGSQVQFLSTLMLKTEAVKEKERERERERERDRVTKLRLTYEKK